MDKILEKVKCYLLDQDGTLYLSKKLIDGAAEAVDRLRKRGKVLFITNNTSKSRADYVKKLNDFNIEASVSDIYTAGNASVDYLNENMAGQSVFLLGTKQLKEEFEEGGIKFNDVKPDIVVIGFDTTLTYSNLSKACSFIRNGTPFLATHPDNNCPTDSGYIPDVGSFLALIKNSCNASPFVICGKPNKPIADGIKKLVGLDGGEIAMVGDRLATDMVFAKNNGFVSALVLSGEATMEDARKSGIKIDLILNSVKDI